jgi:ribosomal-protein-alanine N-acetyltransferase
VTRYYGVSYGSLEETQAQMDWYDYLLESQTGIWWGICFTHDPSRLIGACGFNEWHRVHNRAEIGYWLLPDYWGPGRHDRMPEGHHPVSRSRPCTCTDRGRGESPTTTAPSLAQKLAFATQALHASANAKQNGAYIDLDHYALLRLWEFGSWRFGNTARETSGIWTVLSTL